MAKGKVGCKNRHCSDYLKEISFKKGTQERKKPERSASLVILFRSGNQPKALRKDKGGLVGEQKTTKPQTVYYNYYRTKEMCLGKHGRTIYYDS